MKSIFVLILLAAGCARQGDAPTMPREAPSIDSDGLASATPAEWTHASLDAERTAHAFQTGQGRVALGHALDNIVITGRLALAERGFGDDSDRLGYEWADLSARFFPTANDLAAGVHPEDLGDHSALSAWLALFYEFCVQKLGQQLCDFLHITDIEVLNFGIPVVFHAHAAESWCVNTLQNAPTDTCQAEYRRHFAGTKWQKADDPFAKWQHYGLEPVVAYWATDIICDVATWGAGAAGLICMPVATLIEIASAKWIAPPLSDRLWGRENP